MFKGVDKIVEYNIKRWNGSYHIILGIIYIIMITDMMLKPARELIELLNVYPETFAFPLLWNSTFFLMLFYFGVIIFFSDAPFGDTMAQFIIIRCGKMKFVLGQIVYIVFMGIIIPLMFFVIQAVMLPVELQNKWGKFWGTMAQTDVATQVGCRINFSYHILWDYKPYIATIITMALCILLTIMTGLALYLFCLLNKKVLGICIISLFLILPNVVEWLNFTTFYWLSPYSWICLDTTMKNYNGSLPSLGYAFFMLSTIISFLIIGIILRVKNMQELPL